MDEVNINKYLSQFNPILIVPVLSAVFGAILVFVFGFKRPNERRFQSNSSKDSLKSSKRKPNAKTDNQTKQQNVTTLKSNVNKKSNDGIVAVTKKGALNDKTTNNNNTISNNNNINKKKTEEKKAENGSPNKKSTAKKLLKETNIAITKKSKSIKKTDEREFDEKPADFDDDGWFTVQSKSTKHKNKIDESTVKVENASPKLSINKTNKLTKVNKSEEKTPIERNEIGGTDSIVEPSNIELKTNDNFIDATIETVNKVVTVAKVNEPIQNVTKNQMIVEPILDENVVESSIAFDEMGEWTDAKPDRKRGNKKKSRKD